MEPLKYPGTVPSAGSCDAFTMAKMRAEAYNTSVGALTDYDCPKCLNRGGFLIPHEDGSVGFRECSCNVIRRCIRQMEASGLKNIISTRTFENFEVHEDWQKVLRDGAMAFAEKPEGGFLICGQSGSGKTHLCTAICRQCLLSGREVRYMPWRDEIGFLKTGSDAAAREDRLRELKQAQILYIDDLFKTGAAADGSRRSTGADVNLAFEVMNYRYTNQLCTVISTELSAQELLQVDEALGGRILEMAKDHIFNIRKDHSRNWRLRQVLEL